MNLLEIVVSLLVVAAMLATVATAINQWRAPDSLTRANLLGPLVGVAVPLLVFAHLIYDWSTTGFDLGNLVKALLVLGGVWVVASVGSFHMGRSLHGVLVTDPDSLPGRSDSQF